MSSEKKLLEKTKQKKQIKTENINKNNDNKHK